MKRPHRPALRGHEFLVYAHTGIQIYRNLALPTAVRSMQEDLWRAASLAAGRMESGNDEVAKLLEEHVACRQNLKEKGQATGWIRCAPGEFAFFRLLRAGEEIEVDLLLDTERGAGSRPNAFPCLIYGGPMTVLPTWLVSPRFYPLLNRLMPRLCRAYEPAHFRIDRPQADAVGTLIMDFGNSGSAFVFTRSGTGATKGDILQVLNPFDPNYQKRPEQESNILRSNLTFLRVDDNECEDPWAVMGSRAEELILVEPLATFVSAPKKYVRDWPERLQTRQPVFPIKGLLGSRSGQQSSHYFVEQAIRHMLQSVLASLTNPRYRHHVPEINPQFDQIMATYPLTWRDPDKELFRSMVEKIAHRQLSLRDEWKAKFRVDLICSEPVAVAAYILWEAFFHLGSSNLNLLATALGNYEAAARDSVRLLVIDIGGGSTDVAVVEVNWAVKENDRSVDVRFQLVDSMRFNRAGDRLSHLIATAIREFLRVKYEISESLALKHSGTLEFTPRIKRQVISKIFELAEAAKAALAEPDASAWQLSPKDEEALLRALKPLFTETAFTKASARAAAAPRLIISQETLCAWVRNDHQCSESNNEPGFMDIFFYLHDLACSLEEKSARPHLIVLSGRTTRLPFLRALTAEHLHVPPHHVRTLSDVWPSSLTLVKHNNMDKLAVVLGAQRFRFGDNIRFHSLPDKPIFNRFIGTVMETPQGLKLQEVYIRPGDSHPLTLSFQIDPHRTIRIGHAFREEGLVQIIATIENRSNEIKHAQVEVEDDFTVHLKAPEEEIIFIEWVPGGADVIIDNFNDTGEIDGVPENLIRDYILNAVPQSKWIAAEEG
ncbi:MAG: hypothetical protein JWL59_2489 [Chthoniobacteraceae bacterium]|nr:hypothetical protein [Chthoniobacteraceae bacterium]